MNWNERAEKAMDAALRFINGHFGNKGPMPVVRIPAQPDSDSDLVLMDYIKESSERIAVLEKALEILGCSAQIVTLKQGDIYNDSHRYRPGDEVIIVGGFYPGEVLGRTVDYPEAAQWLREQQ